MNPFAYIIVFMIMMSFNIKPLNNQISLINKVNTSFNYDSPEMYIFGLDKYNIPGIIPKHFCDKFKGTKSYLECLNFDYCMIVFISKLQLDDIDKVKLYLNLFKCAKKSINVKKKLN